MKIARFLHVQGSGDFGVLRSHDKRYGHRRQQISQLHFGVHGRDPGLPCQLDDNGKDVQKNVVVFHVRVKRFHFGLVQRNARQ